MFPDALRTRPFSRGEECYVPRELFGYSLGILVSFLILILLFISISVQHMFSYFVVVDCFKWPLLGVFIGHFSMFCIFSFFLGVYNRLCT